MRMCKNIKGRKLCFYYIQICSAKSQLYMIHLQLITTSNLFFIVAKMCISYIFILKNFLFYT